MDKEEAVVLLCGPVIGMFLGAISATALSPDPSIESVKSGYSFIHGNATYQCRKTNELAEGEK